MGIPFVLETWSLTSWNECRLPLWFSEDILQSGNYAAEKACPNEVCGFFIQKDSSVILHSFTGLASPWSCIASPDEVIRFAYWLEEASCIILA